MTDQQLARILQDVGLTLADFRCIATVDDVELDEVTIVSDPNIPDMIEE